MAGLGQVYERAARPFAAPLIADRMLAEAEHATVRRCLTTWMLGMKHALRPMLAAGHGAIVNIASLAGIRVAPYASYAYRSAKAGVVHPSEASAVLYAARGIRVNVVAPGLMLTPNRAERMDTATRTRIATQFHPMGRMIDPGKIADAAVWAASPQSSGVTGLVILVDGGRRRDDETRIYRKISVYDCPFLCAGALLCQSR